MDLYKIPVLNLIVRAFDLETENADSESHLQDELIDMCVDLKAKSLLKPKRDYWSNGNTTTK